jgi:hypothetical protein
MSGQNAMLSGQTSHSEVDERTGDEIVKLLIKRLFLRRASPKTKITVHFIVNIMIFECLLFEGYSCKRLQTLYTY